MIFNMSSRYILHFILNQNAPTVPGSYASYVRVFLNNALIMVGTSKQINSRF